MDETFLAEQERFLTEALGFAISAGGDLMYEGDVHRTATIAEITMWQLLLTPQAEWHEKMPLLMAAECTGTFA